jgi:antitoxin component of MazEF toxin-antitoxin module
MRRKLEDKNIRKVFKKSGSYCVTVPIEIIKDLKIREGQKLEFRKRGGDIVISDWPARNAKA